MNLSSSALFWALLVVVAIVVVVMFRRRDRPRKLNAPTRPLAPAPEPADEYLDSSHILGPVFDDPALEAARKKALRDTGSPPRGT